MLFNKIFHITSLIFFAATVTGRPTCTSGTHCRIQPANLDGTVPTHLVSEQQLFAKLAPLVYKRVTFAEQGWTNQHYSRENDAKGPAIKHTPAGLAHLKVAKKHRKVADKHYAAAIAHLKAGNRKAANKSEQLGDAHARLATLHRAVANELHVE